MKTITSAILLTATFLIAGCNNKQAEDTAAMRAMMEKQQAADAAQTKRKEDMFSAMKAGKKAP